MNDFLDYCPFTIWMELLEENNYNKRRRPYKIPGIVILCLAKLRKLGEFHSGSCGRNFIKRFNEGL